MLAGAELKHMRPPAAYAQVWRCSMKPDAKSLPEGMSFDSSAESGDNEHVHLHSSCKSSLVRSLHVPKYCQHCTQQEAVLMTLTSERGVSRPSHHQLAYIAMEEQFRPSSQSVASEAEGLMIHHSYQVGIIQVGCVVRRCEDGPKAKTAARAAGGTYCQTDHRLTV